METVGVVIPAYHPDVDRLVRYVEALAERVDPATIRIELDDPRSGVEARLSALPATVNVVDQRRGKGRAIAAGFDALGAGIETYAFFDADGSTPVDSAVDVLDPVVHGRVDLAVGSRRHPDAVVESHQTRVRRRLGDAFAWLARRLLPVALHDYQCGAKALSARVWADVRDHLREPGFAWDIELVALAAALGYRLREVPTTWIDRPASTVAPVWTTVSMTRALLVVHRRARRVKRGAVHGALGGALEHTGTEDRG